MDKIIIRDVEIYGRHGVNSIEKIKEQPFIIDVEMKVNLKKPGKTDCLEDTVNYAAANKLITEIVQSTSFNLLEKLAEELCSAILNNFDKVNAVKICIKKPEAPMEGSFKWVGVEIERTKKLS